MKICIYCESLRTATSGTPMRAMIRELLQQRKQDKFLMVVRKGYQQDAVLMQFFESLNTFSNWELIEDPLSRKKSNLLGLLRYKHYCKVNVEADVYLNPDCNSLGSKAHPLIVTITDLSSFRSIEYTSYKKNWQLQLRRFMMSNAIAEADKVVAISGSTAREVAARFPKAEKKTTVVYNGIQPEWLTQNVPQQKGEKYWIWWGMISGRKNLDGLLKAYASLKKEINELPLIRIVYGNQVLPENIKELIHELDLDACIRVEKSKPLDQLIRIVNGSSGLVFPSHVEGFGMPVIESFARGIPVMTSSTTSLTEVAGAHGILVDPADIASIKEGLKNLLESKTSGAEVEARIQWASKFTPASAAAEFSKMIDELKPATEKKAYELQHV